MEAKKREIHQEGIRSHLGIYYLSKKCVKLYEDHVKTPRRPKSRLEQVERYPLFLSRMIQHHRSI